MNQILVLYIVHSKISRNTTIQKPEILIAAQYTTSQKWCFAPATGIGKMAFN